MTEKEKALQKYFDVFEALTIPIAVYGNNRDTSCFIVIIGDGSVFRFSDFGFRILRC